MAPPTASPGPPPPCPCSVPKTTYVDRQFLRAGNKEEDYYDALERSTTVYVGNLSFYTTEEQIHEVFSKVGDVRRIIMGLDRHRHTPCGFCFVMFYTREDTLHATKYLNGTCIDGRIIRVDIDWGFEEGRQYGRGLSGGQVRDDMRNDFDADRGGWGKAETMPVPQFRRGGGKRRGRDREDRRERGGPGEGGDGMAVDEADEGRGGGGKRQRADEHDDRAD